MESLLAITYTNNLLVMFADWFYSKKDGSILYSNYPYDRVNGVNFSYNTFPASSRIPNNSTDPVNVVILIYVCSDLLTGISNSCFSWAYKYAK